MKRIVPIVLFLLFLTSCTVKEYTPRIPDLYKCNITVYSGDFSYDGEFCKNDSLISVTVTSTRASGLEMIFDGKTLTMNYGGYVYEQKWPEYDEAKTVESTIEIAVQVNGKVRSTIAVPADGNKDDIISQAKEELGDRIAGKEIVKEIYVPGRIVNIVIKG